MRDLVRRRRISVILVLLAILVVCVVVAAAVGTVYVPFGDVVKMCWNKLSPFNFARRTSAFGVTVLAK